MSDDSSPRPIQAGTIREASTSGAEVQDLLLTKIGPALEGVPIEVGIAGLISASLIYMFPEISEEELIEGVKFVSGAMVTFLDAIVNPVDPSRVN